MSSDSPTTLPRYGNEAPKGPPNWDQLVQVQFGNLYYVPNPSIVTVALCVLACLSITVWAAIATRRQNKVSDPIIHYFFGWPHCRFWITIMLAIVSFSWALFDNAFIEVSTWVEQRLFLTQFIFEVFWEFTKVFLLWNIYDLLFHLMRYAPLGQGTLCRMHFWRYGIVRKAICGVFFLLAFVMMCLRVSYLSVKVFHPPTAGDESYKTYDVTENAAVALCYIRDILYFLVTLETLVASGLLLDNRRSKEGSGSKAAYILCLVWITIPLFLGGFFTFMSTCIRPPPEANVGYSGTPLGDTDLTLATIQYTASIFSGFAVVLPLAGILMVAKRMDSYKGKGERLGSETSDTMEIMLNARKLGRSDAYPANLQSMAERPGTSKSNYEVRITGGVSPV